MVVLLAALFGATLAGWLSHRNLAQKFDDLRSRFESIEQKLENHQTRITALEERTAAVRR